MKNSNFDKKLDKEEIQEMLNKVRHYHNDLRDEEEAIKICDEILKQDPENRDALLIKAGSLPQINKEKESLQLIAKIIEKWPNHWEAYYLLGLRLFNINEEMAMESLIKSIKLKKTFDNCISLAQLMYFMQNKQYEDYLEYAQEINDLRFEAYMENYWEWEIC
jgi:tetratricopeptide (TPR) repeat protein